MSIQSKKEIFKRHLNTFFEVRPAGMETQRIELVDVTDKSNTTMDAFSLLFRGEKGRVFRHETCTLTHAGMGELSIFLGPVHTGKTDAVYYQAIFNSPKGGDTGGNRREKQGN